MGARKDAAAEAVEDATPTATDAGEAAAETDIRLGLIEEALADLSGKISDMETTADYGNSVIIRELFEKIGAIFKRLWPLQQTDVAGLMKEYLAVLPGSEEEDENG